MEIPFQISTSIRRGGSISWSAALQYRALCLHLNFSGHAGLYLPQPADSLLTIIPQSLVWSRAISRATRFHSSHPHECTTLVFPDKWLHEYFFDIREELPAPFDGLLLDSSKPQAICTRLLTPDDRTWTVIENCNSQRSHCAQRLLDSSKLCNFLVKEIFTPTSAAIIQLRGEKLNKDRIQRVKDYLATHLEDSPSLPQLGEIAGCSPSYLSRNFSQIEGITLSAWLRQTRIEAASQLLLSGTCNISEACLRVGYRSFSHFSHAFSHQMGLSPTRWLQQLQET